MLFVVKVKNAQSYDTIVVEAEKEEDVKNIVTRNIEKPYCKYWHHYIDSIRPLKEIEVL